EAIPLLLVVLLMISAGGDDVRAQPGITSVLAGARNEKQVEENAVAADFELSTEELRVIRDAAVELNGPV
ncbi:MAG: hypothetical protein R6V12_11570, partial [Candidatus Hydrogenedentota bacterium]